jgi:hypothetical protein
MTIRCTGCGRAIRVPDEKAQNPRLKVKCTCGTVFALADAMTAAEDAASAERAVVAPETASPFVGHVSDPSPASITSPLEDLVDTPPPTPEPVPARRTRPPGGWRRCVNHHAAQSQSVCTSCQIGYCPDCEKKTENAVVCPVCDGPCVPAAQYEGEQERKRQRQRSLMEEIEVIARYPVREPIAFAVLAAVSGLLAFCSRFGSVLEIVGIVLSQLALFACCCYAMSRVASGDLKGFNPPLDDLQGLVPSLTLGLGALVVSTGPLLLILFWSGISVARSFVADAPTVAPTMAVAHAATDAGEDGEAVEGPRLEGGALLLATLLLIPAILWKIVYTPVALVVAARSRSLLSTLNPAVGFDTVKKMGPVSWQAILICSVLAFVQWFLNFVLSWLWIPGGMVGSFVSAYVYLAIGCTLGLAVFKKAPELRSE